MVKKKFIADKKNKVKKGVITNGQFFLAKNEKERQLSFEDINVEVLTEQEKERVESQMGEANQEVAKQGTKKKKITNLLFFLLNLGIVAGILIYQLTHTEVESFGSLLASGLFRPQYILPLICCFFGGMLIDAFRTNTLIKQATKKGNFGLAYKTVSQGRYWDGITPLSAGGEPFQIFYMSKYGMKAEQSISVTMSRHLIFQLSWILIGIFATIYSSFYYTETNIVSVASYIGIGFNALILSCVWFLSISKKFGKLLIAKLIKLLYKIKLIKNYDKLYEKVMTTVSNFQTTMAKFTKKIWLFIGLVLSQLIQMIISYTIPYVIFLLLGGTADASVWIYMMMLNILIDLASSFIPTPGGTGMSEVSFTIVFTSIFPNGTAFWGLLIWRFMTYYMFLIQGVVVTIYDYAIADKKFEWKKKKWELEAESNKFKENQIKKYNKNSKGKIKI